MGQIIVILRRYVHPLSLMLLGLLLPTQLALHGWPSTSYVHGVRVDYLAPYLSLFDVYVCAVVIVYSKDVVHIITRLTMRIILPLGLLIGLNTVFSLTPLLTLTVWIRLVITSLAISILLRRTPDSLAPLLIGLLVSSILQLALGTLQFFTQSSLQGVWYLLGERALQTSLPGVATVSVSGAEYLRPYGTFSHPNTMGGYSLAIFFLMRWLRTRDLDTLSRRCVDLISVITPFLIVFSFSKVAITMFVVGNIILLVLDRDYRGCVLCLVARCTALLVLLAVSLIPLGDPYSLIKRVTLMSNALEIIMQHPVWGVGAGAYVLAQSTLTVIPRLAPLYQPVHNIFVLALAELGAGGTLVVAALIHLSHVVLRLDRYLAVLIGAVVVTGMLDHYWFTQMQTRSLAILIIFTVVTLGQSNREGAQGKSQL